MGKGDHSEFDQGLCKEHHFKQKITLQLKRIFMYDIIGDIHGHATILKNLFDKLGYKKGINGYFHPERKAVFVGDFTNRGPEIRKTLRTVRQMVEAGNAMAVLGNHEINNILYHLRPENDVPLLDIHGKRYLSVTQTIEEFKPYAQEWKEHRKWLRTLPFFLELEGIRVAHAYWSDSHIRIIKENLPEAKISKQIFRDLILNPHSDLSQAILQTTRGVHLILPPDLKIMDHRKRNHRFFRIRWWETPEGKSFQNWSFESKFRLPNYTIPPEIYPRFEIYPEDAPPLFFGHYCRGRGPFVIRKNLCCIDSCITSHKMLSAYRWNGESELDPQQIVVAGPS